MKSMTTEVNMTMRNMKVERAKHSLILTTISQDKRDLRRN